MRRERETIIGLVTRPTKKTPTCLEPIKLAPMSMSMGIKNGKKNVYGVGIAKMGISIGISLTLPIHTTYLLYRYPLHIRPI